MVTLPEASAAENLHHRATCWHDKVRNVIQSDEVRAVLDNQAEMSLMSRLARSPSGYILQRGSDSVSVYLLTFCLVWALGL